MSPIGLIVTILVIVVVVYLISILPIDGRLKQVCEILVVLVAIVWLLTSVFGLGSVGTLRID